MTDTPPATVALTSSAPLTISEFGRSSGLSHKALRLYDMSGLLPPAEIDPANGYRLYAADQLERARRISLLRQLDMPLAMVAEVLAGTEDEALSRLDAWWREQEATMRARRGSLSYLRGKLAHTDLADISHFPVAIRQVPATKIASITRDVDQQGLEAHLIGCRAEIMQHLRGAGAELDIGYVAIYHGFVTPDSEAPVEVCVPFTGTVDPGADIMIRMEPARTEAYAVVSRDECAFPQILVAYDAVSAWVAGHRHTPVGSPREIYIADWCLIGATDPFVYVAQPIA
jgi:DNA-binding transcriptional MerR regulator